MFITQDSIHTHMTPNNNNWKAFTVCCIPFFLQQFAEKRILFILEGALRKQHDECTFHWNSTIQSAATDIKLNPS